MSTGEVGCEHELTFACGWFPIAVSSRRQSQLRYYWADNAVQVRMVNAQQEYGMECE